MPEINVELSEGQFETQTEWAADEVMRKFGGDGPKALSALIAALCESSVDILQNIKASGEYCIAHGIAPVLPINEDVKNATIRTSMIMAIISVLMMRNVLDIDMDSDAELPDFKMPDGTKAN